VLSLAAILPTLPPRVVFAEWIWLHDSAFVHPSAEDSRENAATEEVVAVMEGVEVECSPGEDALQAVRAELKAAAQTRAQPRSRTHSPANDAPDFEELRADAIVTVAETFMRFDRPRRRAEPPSESSGGVPGPAG
jgi:hypothetical protein